MDTYEKKYKEALEKAKRFCTLPTDKATMEEIFPELRESEDERMLNTIIRGFENWKGNGNMLFNNTDVDDILAYLEKQKDQKPILQEDFDTAKHEALWEEQKPAEYLDKDKVYAVMKKLHDLSFSRLIPINSDEYKKIDEITCDIRNFLNYPIEQKPLEKQDYSGLNDLERAIHRCFLVAGVENVPVTIIKETAQDCLAQMKPAEWEDYKDKVNIPYCSSEPEWSEEDEKMLSDLRNTRGCLMNAGAISFKTKKKFSNWLKSLRPSWKPSDEQMEALLNILHPDAPYELKSLYEQLKKL